ncbi:glycosyltransferase family 2 protein [Paracoccus sp. S3-43]|uniref:glycosyltransferase family 2 protein n=1 Tax=Paracoccus sp. S3-43 TaxID=3030011 RepID=UPI0023B173D5|nr:glycosyltransferase family 2 protein [Paracoccus sp. S3-43]WEF25356.1 glycosyltransferase family 2 protein [Paracoccus sp. S3-43]
MCSVAASPRLTWALCVATLNRIDMLELCVTCALAQTRPPSEIVIVDASDDWQSHRDRIAAIVAGRVPLIYRPATERSSAVQRNSAITECSADICTFVDDDSFMHDDCMETILRVYERDTDHEIVAISAGNGPSPLEIGGVTSKPVANLSSYAAMIKKSRLGQFLWRELFLMGRAVTFIPYAGPFGSPIPEWASSFRPEVVATIHIGAGRMTVRRNALMREMFEPAFRSYCPGEDFDLSYRLSRIGMICAVPSARIYHHEVAASRIRREQELVLSICNAAFLVRKHSPDLDRDRRRWAVLMARRRVAEFLKDGLMRRWRLPQLRAARRAAAISRQILAFPDDAGLEDWYISVQQNILKRP